ncbi:alpha/beta fold hydrolase [Peterkaempfera bronchialis]|uniref:Alpha/beta fold hydrolase n=1 Tax=Peterkaempfera bronchialis TaxID=2126346 RepID=A0A345SXE3_9ACTN|nr:alpha/beta fold hydrolase [Peterkaempfera bronchialis]AXI78398.1 alpha/beta fold hydrolase [Peterkaempfera bronchialis]
MVDVHHRHAVIQGHRIFYREAGPAGAETVVLLHGFPSSSHMYRHLIPALADRYHVIAPDYLGSGASDTPPVGEFTYTFDSITDIVDELLDALGVQRYALYVQDFGAPVGFRIAARHPERITAIVTQNGNAYVDGLNPELLDVSDSTPRTEESLRENLTLDFTRQMYLTGVPDPSLVSPDTWLYDQTLLERPGVKDIQLALLADYPANVARYPEFQEYFRTSQVPLLAVWGANDQVFFAPGATAFGRDLPDAEIHLLNTGHFALETHLDTIVGHVRAFLGRVLTA